MRRTIGLVGCAALLMPGAAAAQEAPKIERGYGSFYNRPGASAAELTDALAKCREVASGAESQINGIPVLTTGLVGIIGGAFAGGRLKRINTENCMVIGGWRLFAMTRPEGDAWEKLPAATREQELAVLVGAQAPARGRMLREWRNDYAEPVLWPKD